MEKVFSALYLNFLVFPSVQNMPMRDLDDEVLNGNIGNPTWHLCLLPTLAKGCMLSFQLSCNQIPTNRQTRTLWRQWGAFLSVFPFIPWITTKAMQSQSIGCALLRGWAGGAVFHLKGMLWSFQGSTLIKQVPHLSLSVF